MLHRIPKVVYNLDIPSTKKNIKYNPYTTKHQMALLTADVSKDDRIRHDTVFQIIKDCLVDVDTDTINKLTNYDIHYIMLQIASKSSTPKRELSITCKCGTVISMDVSMLDLECHFHKGHTNKISFTDNQGMVMKYPAYVPSIKDMKLEDLETRYTDVVIPYIDYIYMGDDIQYAQDYSVEELKDYLDDLEPINSGKIFEFINTAPSVYKEYKFGCPGCKEKLTYKIEGIENFFF